MEIKEKKVIKNENGNYLKIEGEEFGKAFIGEIHSVGYTFILESLKISISTNTKKDEWCFNVSQDDNTIATFKESNEPWFPSRQRDSYICKRIEQKTSLEEKEVKELWNDLIAIMAQHRPQFKAFSKQRTTTKDRGPVDQEIHEKAMNILKKEKPLKYICDIINKVHKGNIALKVAMALTYPALLAKAKIHLFLIGESDKGKSHLTNIFVDHLLPEDVAENMIGCTPKAPIYELIDNPEAMNMKILVFDDANMEEAEIRRLVRVLRDLEPGQLRYYKTIIESQAQKIVVRGICSIWETSVDYPSDIQDKRRGLILKAEDSKQQQKVVEKEIRRKFGEGEIHKVPDEFNVIRQAYSVLQGTKIQGVEIPYHQRIAGIYGSSANQLFMALIYGSAILHYFQREKTEDEKIVANENDFRIAKKIFEKTMSTKKLKPYEVKILEHLPFFECVYDEKVNTGEIARLLQTSTPQASNILKRLTEEKLINSIRNPDDKREKFWYKIRVKESQIRLLAPGEEEIIEEHGAPSVEEIKGKPVVTPISANLAIKELKTIDKADVKLASLLIENYKFSDETLTPEKCVEIFEEKYGIGSENKKEELLKLFEMLLYKSDDFDLEDDFSDLSNFL